MVINKMKVFKNLGIEVLDLLRHIYYRNQAECDCSNYDNDGYDIWVIIILLLLIYGMYIMLFS